MKKLSSLLICTIAADSCVAATPTFTVDAGHLAGKVSPRLYVLPIMAA
jgi:hypothetical protein